MGTKHKLTEFLYDSQKKRLLNDVSTISKSEKSLIDDAVVECIVTDSRTFNDFSKIGMRNFLNVIRPSYKPPCRQTIMKRTKSK